MQNFQNLKNLTKTSSPQFSFPNLSFDTFPGKIPFNPPLLFKFNQLIRRQSTNRFFNKDVLNKKQRIQILFGIMQKTFCLLEFKLETFYLCIHIFDAVISKFPIHKNQMLPLALVCMQISSKISEPQGKIISYEDIHNHIWRFNIYEYIQFEKIIVNKQNESKPK